MAKNIENIMVREKPVTKEHILYNANDMNFRKEKTEIGTERQCYLGQGREDGGQQAMSKEHRVSL